MQFGGVLHEGVGGGVEEYAVDFEAIGLTPAHIEWAMGYHTGQSPEPLPELIAELLIEAPGHIEGRAGARTLPPECVTIQQDCMQLQGVTFHTGTRIARLLDVSESMAVFAATVGLSTDAWIKGFYERGDPMRGYIADTIGSEAVEGAAKWLEERIIDRAIESSLYTTSPFSPGYCDWGVQEQHMLFSLLPDDFCGIRLTDSALMLPIKSVSGVIGIGANCERVVTACSICTLETCFKRRR
jgi:hypothetical protein